MEKFIKIVLGIGCMLIICSFLILYFVWNNILLSSMSLWSLWFGSLIFGMLFLGGALCELVGELIDKKTIKEKNLKVKENRKYMDKMVDLNEK